jgi:hypothetical protein
MTARDIAIVLAGIGAVTAGAGIGYAGWRLGVAADSAAITARELLGEVYALRAAIVGDGYPTVPLPLAQQVLYRIDERAADVTVRADKQITALRGDAMARIDNIESDTNMRLGDTLKRVDAALATVDGIRQDVKPTLDGAAALEADIKDSWDDLYWDVKASVESGTVTMHSVAVASEAISAAAPKLAASGVEIGKSIDGIAGDVKREADEITAPKKWWQKVLGPVYTVGRLVAAFL